MKQIKSYYTEGEYKEATVRIRNGADYVQRLRREAGSNESNACLVFLFSDDAQINAYTLSYLPAIKSAMCSNIFIIVSPYEIMEEFVGRECKCPYVFINCGVSDMENVCKYYATYREYEPEYFSSGVIINGSPYVEDERMRKIIGYNGITVREYVAFAIMRLKSLPEENDINEAPANQELIEVNIPKARDYNLADALKEIEGGKRIYDRIRENHPEEMIYLVPYPGTGDMYLVGMYLADRMRYDKVESGVLVVSAGACKRIYSLMETGANISEVITLDGRTDAVKLIRFAKQVGYERLRLVMINDAFDLIDIGKLRGYKDLDFNTLFQKTVFFSDIKRHGVKFRNEDADSLYDANDIHKAGTVVLAPYTKSMAPVSMLFWERMADALKALGYDVVTNVSGDEIPVKGTKGVMVPYEMILDFLDKSAAFIGMRSGLCDVISGANTKKIILYHPFVEPNTSSSIGFFGLGNMELGDDNLYEIVTDGVSLEIVKQVTNIVLH